MIECVILVRHPNGGVVAITDEEGEQVEVFPDYESADELAIHHRFCQAFPHQIVELEI